MSSNEYIEKKSGRVYMCVEFNYSLKHRFTWV